MAGKKLQITLSDEVLEKLENMAKDKGVSKSAMISILITESK
ncbi:CopG family transcriptional regulator [Lactococcus lactis]|jgi:metal-responsive CopG/Arc/MetJ family transcriptional regulator|nr:ribbon-helix-helix domain-containing protein [Lactococcus lactis]MDN6641353.1 ribbon-helix-helix domain-containing protein [Tetragenococcus sp.]MDN6278865.1 ribbon-helix-helix domain-containing protein [Lactococcus lactis]MDN6473907.1 ribbon-helix-helix domain-containing protein [Lactococcus lactis]MDN6506776.1 ribbon-helix-helix domain-containing protein [Lactococcus lactis]